MKSSRLSRRLLSTIAAIVLVTILGSLTTSGALSTAELQVLASTAGQAAPVLGLVGTVWFGLAAWFVALGSRPARAFVVVGAVIGTAALVNGLLVATLASAALLVLAAFQNLENELVALFAVLAEERLDVLERRRLERLESVAFVDAADHADDVLAPADIVRKKIACAGRWFC